MSGWLQTFPVGNEQQIDDGVVLEDCGLVSLNNVEVFARRIATSEKAAFLTQADASRSDVRLNGDHRDATGKRHLDFILQSTS